MANEVVVSTTTIPSIGGGGCKVYPVSNKPFPWVQVTLLGMLLLNESLCSMVLMPFVGLFVAHLLKISPDEAGYASGFLVGVFQLALVMSGKWWGNFSDTHGRKPALLLGVVLSAVAIIFFGLSPNIYVALLWRFVHGLTNGISAVAKSAMAEVAGPVDETKGFATISLAWGVGSLVGPAIGGFLYDPTQKPHLGLGKTPLLSDYPALLPALVIAVYSAGISVFAMLFLVESNPSDVPITIYSFVPIPIADFINWLFGGKMVEWDVYSSDDPFDEDQIPQEIVAANTTTTIGGGGGGVSNTNNHHQRSISNATHMTRMSSTDDAFGQQHHPGGMDDEDLSYRVAGNNHSSSNTMAPSFSAPNRSRHHHSTITIYAPSKDGDGDATTVTRTMPPPNNNNAASISGDSHRVLMEGSTNTADPPSLSASGVHSRRLLAQYQVGHHTTTTTSGKTTTTTKTTTTNSTNGSSSVGGVSMQSLCIPASQLLAKPVTDLPKKLTFTEAFINPNTRAAILIYMCVAFAEIGFQETFPLWGVASIRSGGLGLTSSEVGSIVVLVSVPCIVSNLAYPKVAERFGTPNPLFGVCVWIWAFSQILLPFASMFQPTLGYQFVVLTMSIWQVSSAWAFSVSYALIARTAPPGNLGAMNGYSQSMGASMRTICPMVLGPVFAWSVGRPHMYPFNHHFAFIISAIPLFFTVKMILHFNKWRR